MQSGNPALNKNTFLDAASGALVARGDEVMTLNGTVNKTGLLLVLVLLGAMFSWSQFSGPASLPAMLPLVIGGAIGGLILGLVTVVQEDLGTGHRAAVCAGRKACSSARCRRSSRCAIPAS